ncbi:MAG: adenosylcobalamin-dependent ribonucleoside-diphosphate reductase, partial [bacterium]
QLWERVAGYVSKAERRFEGRDVDSVRESFLGMLSRREFLPNSPTLMNAGTSIDQLAACFVLPVHDSIESIFETIKNTALIHQSGGGTGFSFSELRPAGDPVKDTGGVASGPVSFMKIFDAATEQIKQGGRRRGANMGVLRVDHPDIETFIDCKREEGTLRNFNLSVGMTETFWNCYENGEPFPLVNPRTGESVRTVQPADLLERIVNGAWETGDPGLLFFDIINEDNPTPRIGAIQATNPCGEVPLLPYEACVLGSINLSKMTSSGGLNREKLSETVRLAVRFLDDVIEMSSFPVEEIGEVMEANRKIGLGVMGFHDMLIDLEIPYDSDRAVECAGNTMELINETAREASKQLASERGPFPNWEDSVYDHPLRNATRTTIAPTGTISMIAGCSAGIEPIYNVAYTKRVLGGLEMISDRFVNKAKQAGIYSEELMDRVRGRTGIQDLNVVPDDLKELFQTAHDVPGLRHLQIQHAFQEHTDNAVSKTVNLPKNATREDIEEIFLRAREMNLKGITVFRSQSKREQVLGDDPLKEECISECEFSYTGS